MRMLPSPFCPLAGQSMFGQNTLFGSMTHLLRLLSTEECHLIRSVFQVQQPDHRSAYTYPGKLPPEIRGSWGGKASLNPTTAWALSMSRLLSALPCVYR